MGFRMENQIDQAPSPCEKMTAEDSDPSFKIFADAVIVYLIPVDEISLVGRD